MIDLRTQAGISELVPGLTGWAQVNGRDSLSIADKVALDKEYLERRNLALDIRILVMTFFNVIGRAGVQH